MHAAFEKLGCTFAVSRHFACQIFADIFEKCFKGFAAFAVGIFDKRISGKSRSHHAEGVVGAGVAVHADHVERAIGHALEKCLQGLRRNMRVGGDKAEHSRHIRLNHAAALAHAADLHLHAVDHRFGGNLL